MYSKELQELIDRLVKIAVFLRLDRDAPNCRYLALGMLQHAGEAYRALPNDSERDVADRLINDSALF